MFNFTDILVVIGMFILRIGVPVAVTAGLVYVLKRLDHKWEEEAQAQQAAQRAIERPLERPVQQPAVVQAPSKVKIGVGRAQLPFDAGRLQQPGLVPRLGTQTCWDIKGCKEADYKECPAYQHPDQACWQARLQADGKIPEKCPTCEIFQRYPLN